jgi:hypothetical protein
MIFVASLSPVDINLRIRIYELYIINLFDNSKKLHRFLISEDQSWLLKKNLSKVPPLMETESKLRETIKNFIVEAWDSTAVLPPVLPPDAVFPPASAASSSDSFLPREIIVHIDRNPRFFSIERLWPEETRFCRWENKAFFLPSRSMRLSSARDLLSSIFVCRRTVLGPAAVVVSGDVGDSLSAGGEAVGVRAFRKRDANRVSMRKVCGKVVKV